MHKVKYSGRLRMRFRLKASSNVASDNAECQLICEFIERFGFVLELSRTCPAEFKNEMRKAKHSEKAPRSQTTQLALYCQ